MASSPYLNTAEVASYLRFVDAHGAPNLDATRKFLQRHAIPMKRRGRSVLVHRDAVEAALTPVLQTPATRCASTPAVSSLSAQPAHLTAGRLSEETRSA